MGEVSATQHDLYERQEQPSPTHIIHVVFGDHAFSEKQEKEWGNGWSREVREQVRKIRPQVIVPDGASPGLYSDPEIFIPADNPSGILPEGETLHLLCGDISLDPERYYHGAEDDTFLVLKRILTDDPMAERGFRDEASLNTSVNIELAQAHLEEVLLAAAFLVTSRGISNFLSKEGFSRRDFLKILVSASGVSTVRGTAFLGLNSLVGANTQPGRNELFSKLAQFVKPIFFHSAFIELRNIKLGLCAYDFARRIDKDEVTSGELRSAIVFGNGHIFEISPNSPEEKLLDELRDNLLRSKDILLTISSLPKSDLVIALKELLAEYTEYQIFQTSQSKGIPSPRRFQIERVNRMIDEVFA